MIHTITKTQYLADPCGSASIPYWKLKSLTVPSGMVILHEREYRAENYADYTDEAYFRLYHDLYNLRKPTPPNGFYVCKADALAFSAHINSCYGGIGVTEAELQAYTERTVYNASLWLAVQNDKTGELAATAIGELDTETGEGTLEWVQVSESYRGRGLGRYMVEELLYRMSGIARFATVSGKCNNLSNPERLYRSCGFMGNDVWHILTRKNA